MMEPAFNDRAAFRARAKAVLLSAPEPVAAPGAGLIGDHKIAGLNPEPAQIARAINAAVLVPITFSEAGGAVILTERSAALRNHSGQVSFPGGRCDPDETPLETALREAEEEIALPRASVNPLGYLPAYYTGTGYRITPVVADVRPGQVLRPNPDEVARVFETPLDILFDPARYRFETRMWQGQERRFYVIDHSDAYIWGATAALMRLLYEKLAQA